jgi:CDP-diacylglycerol--serine O-phosphatidyltransferase
VAPEADPTCREPTLGRGEGAQGDEEGALPAPLRLHGRQHRHGLLRGHGRAARLPDARGRAGGWEFARATVHFDNAARAIGWAILFDTLDGRIARLTKTTTEIGIQFDSIADVLTFGIAPAVLVYAWGYGGPSSGGQPRHGTTIHKLGWFLSFMFLICGALGSRDSTCRPRARARSRRGARRSIRRVFVGLPIPAAAGLLAAIVHFAPRPLVAYGATGRRSTEGLLMGLVAVLSVLMVSTIKYSSFKTLGAGKRSTMKVMPLIAAVGMLVWLFSRYVLLALVLRVRAARPALPHRGPVRPAPRRGRVRRTRECVP